MQLPVCVMVSVNVQPCACADLPDPSNKTAGSTNRKKACLSIENSMCVVLRNPIMEFNVLQKASLQIWVILIVVNNGLMLLTIALSSIKDEKKIIFADSDERSKSFPD